MQIQKTRAKCAALHAHGNAFQRFIAPTNQNLIANRKSLFLQRQKMTKEFFEFCLPLRFSVRGLIVFFRVKWMDALITFVFRTNRARLKKHRSISRALQKQVYITIRLSYWWIVLTIVLNVLPAINFLRANYRKPFCTWTSYYRPTSNGLFSQHLGSHQYAWSSWA